MGYCAWSSSFSASFLASVPLVLHGYCCCGTSGSKSSTASMQGAGRAAGEDIVNPIKEVAWMRRLSAEISRPVTFAMIQVDAAPELWRDLMAASMEAVADGADIWPQVAGRATGLLSGHHTTYCLLDVIPAYQQLKARKLTHEQLLVELRDPCLLYTSPSPRDRTRTRMPSSA